jgi:hypothetical protein
MTFRVLVFAALVPVLALSMSACGGSGSGASGTTTSIVLGRSIGGVALAEQRADVERHLGRGFIVHAEDQKPPEPNPPCTLRRFGTTTA